MLQEILQTIRKELVDASKKRKHPFKYFAFTTVSVGVPATRTVVLREVIEDFSIVFYTDKRSKKVKEFASNPKVSLLFFDPEKLVQLRIRGEVHLITDKSKIKRTWADIPDASKKDYKTLNSPGSKIKDHNQVEYSDSTDNFCMVKVNPTKMEYLKLKRPNHIRVSFELKNKVWEGQFLVP